MDHQQRMIVAASIEKLMAKEEGSAEHARTIINALKDLKLSSPFQVVTKSKKEDGSAEGLTEHGNASFDQGEESKIREYGVYKERVGKWIIIKEVGSSKSNFMLTIHHFLHQGLGVESHKEYFLEYEVDLTPTAFGYIGDPEKWFSFWWLSIYFRAPVVIFGESKRKKRLCLSISNQD
jgi:hypothetical protein